MIMFEYSRQEAVVVAVRSCGHHAPCILSSHTLVPRYLQAMLSSVDEQLYAKYGQGKIADKISRALSFAASLTAKDATKAVARRAKHSASTIASDAALSA